MRWQRTSTVGELPADPLGEAVAGAVADVLAGATVELHYRPAESAAPEPPPEPGTAAAAGAGPAGWELTLLVRLQDRLAHLVDAHDPMSLAELLGVLPGAGVPCSASVSVPFLGDVSSISSIFSISSSSVPFLGYALPPLCRASIS